MMSSVITDSLDSRFDSSRLEELQNFKSRILFFYTLGRASASQHTRNMLQTARRCLPAARRALHAGRTARAAGDAFVIPVPEMGDSITEGTIVAWEKQPGEAFAADEVILVLETDKVSASERAWVRSTARAASALLPTHNMRVALLLHALTLCPPRTAPPHCYVGVRRRARRSGGRDG